MDMPKRIIVADSCCDLPEDLRNDPRIRLVPFSITLDGQQYIDDDTLDVKQFVQKMAACPTPPRSSCPSPHDFQEKFLGVTEIFVTTISSQLSHSYKSAMLAASMAKEDEPSLKIHVFDSRSASAAETLVCLHLLELMEQELDYSEIVAAGETFIAAMETRFLLETLEHLAKNGRLKPVLAKLADILAIKPIMGANPAGEIQAIEKVKGYQRALQRLGALVAEGCQQQEKKKLVIAHCNCLERVRPLGASIQSSCPDVKVHIVDTAGLSSTYADDGGIVIAY
jgi:DegV family protein with EDD domain